MFLAAMIGGETLFELRTALQLAELEQEGVSMASIHLTFLGNLVTQQISCEIFREKFVARLISYSYLSLLIN